MYIQQLESSASVFSSSPNQEAYSASILQSITALACTASGFYTITCLTIKDQFVMTSEPSGSHDHIICALYSIVVYKSEQFRPILALALAHPYRTVDWIKASAQFTTHQPPHLQNQPHLRPLPKCPSSTDYRPLCFIIACVSQRSCTDHHNPVPGRSYNIRPSTRQLRFSVQEVDYPE